MHGLLLSRTHTGVFVARSFSLAVGLENPTHTGHREVQVGDDLILLAAHYLLDMASTPVTDKAPAADNNGGSGDATAASWTDSKVQHLRLEAIELLEIGHRQSPHNFQMRLLLVRLCVKVLSSAVSKCHFFSITGGSGGAAAVFDVVRCGFLGRPVLRLISF